MLRYRTAAAGSRLATWAFRKMRQRHVRGFATPCAHHLERTLDPFIETQLQMNQLVDPRLRALEAHDGNIER